MKKALLLFLCACLLTLSACGSTEQVSTTASEPRTESRVLEPVTLEDVLSANDDYGAVSDADGVSVIDASVQYRTEDSFRLEAIAVRFAQNAVRESLTDPDSLEISDCSVWNCVDDGTTAYYTIHLNASYLVGPGEQIERGFFYDVGVHKSDETAFDAADAIDAALDACSIYQQTARNAVLDASSSAPDAFEDAAKQIAQMRLKDAASGKVLSAKLRAEESDETLSVWDVLCEGQNDFGMKLKDVYTVYLSYADDQFVEYDPTDPA